VVGATDREGAVGRAILENLRDEFTGEVVPVNPSRDEVLGSVLSGRVERAADRSGGGRGSARDRDRVDPRPRRGGHRDVVVITAGFSETGGEGAERERRLRAVAGEHDLNVVGPNSLGIMATSNGMNATFGPESALEGSISLESQSGAFITAVLDWANEQGNRVSRRGLAGQQDRPGRDGLRPRVGATTRRPTSSSAT